MNTEIAHISLCSYARFKSTMYNCVFSTRLKVNRQWIKKLLKFLYILIQNLESTMYNCVMYVKIDQIDGCHVNYFSLHWKKPNYRNLVKFSTPKFRYSHNSITACVWERKRRENQEHPHHKPNTFSLPLGEKGS